MHCALDIEDILRHVFRYLDRRWLVRAARTCKSWKEPALDGIWREIPSVEHLFALFPSECVSGNNPFEVMAFRRPLIPVDWIRFDYYAPRVLRIVPSESRWTRWSAHESAYLYLSHFRRTSLLPNLKHWSWDTQRGAGDIVAAMTFLNSTVTSIEVTFGHATPYESIFAFLCNLPDRAPKLDSLSITYNDREWPEWRLEVIMNTLATMFLHLPHLHKLSLPFFMDTPSFISYIGAIPTLQDLTISCAEKLVGHFVDDDAEETPVEDEEALFINMARVELQSTMSSCLRFLNRISSQHLEVVHLTVLHLRSADQLSTCVATISKHAPTLRSFSLHFTPAPHDVQHDNTWFALDDLTQCHNLEYISITHPRTLPFTDEDIYLAARAWPKLTVLRLNPRPTRSIQDPELTLESVVHLVRYCPRLQVLRLYLNTREVPSVPPYNSHSVKTLDFGISNRTETQQLATFIASVCPEATVTGAEAWKEVDIILSVNKATRLTDKKQIEALQAEVERLKAMLLNGASPLGVGWVPPAAILAPSQVVSYPQTPQLVMVKRS